MTTYEVCNYNFEFIGTVDALTPEAALAAAKKKWPFTIGLMVEPRNDCAYPTH